jgi:oligoendopeptidase F
MAEKKHTPNFHPGGQKGKLHREMGIPEGQKIPAKKLEAATHSKDREVRDDAIRAETMKGWTHKGPGKGA